MITVLASPKAFKGRDGDNQRRAIQSWRSIHPEVEVMLFGAAPGTAEICGELGLRHLPDVACSPSGVPFFNSIVGCAETLGRHPVQLYLNCDILLNRDILAAIQAMPFSPFLITGQRFDLTREAEFSLETPDWSAALTELTAAGRGQLHGPSGMDYFIFPKWLWKSLPPLVIGRIGYDNALIAHAIRHGIPVVDATDAIPAVHQYHDYLHLGARENDKRRDPDVRQNLRLHRVGHSPPDMSDAPWRLTPAGLTRIRFPNGLLRYCEILLHYRFQCDWLWIPFRGLNRLRRMVKPQP